MNDLRSKLPTSPQKQAAVVAVLTNKYNYQFGGKKHESVTNETKDKVEKFCHRKDIVYTMPGKGDWDDNLDRGGYKEFGNTF